MLWGRITQACGVEQAARIEARSSRRMLTCADRWTNLIRLTAAGFAAAVGGADAVALGAFTDAIGAADPFASRLSRNTQLILMEEAHLGRVSDPAGGSWAMEAQTAELARAAWTAFTTIETAGGLAAALQAGVVGDAVDRSREKLIAALGDRTLRRDRGHRLQERRSRASKRGPRSRSDSFGAPDDRRPGTDSACPPLAPVRLEPMVAQ